MLREGRSVNLDLCWDYKYGPCEASTLGGSPSSRHSSQQDHDADIHLLYNTMCLGKSAFRLFPAQGMGHNLGEARVSQPWESCAGPMPRSLPFLLSLFYPLPPILTVLGKTAGIYHLLRFTDDSKLQLWFRISGLSQWFSNLSEITRNVC